MGKVAHISKVKVTKEPGNNKIKRIQIEGWPEVTRMGVHGGIAEFFKVKPDEPMPATLDYLVAAIGGCMTGTIGSAMEGRGLHADAEHLEAMTEGILEDVDGKLLLERALAEARVAFVPGAPFFAEVPANDTIRLSYSLPADAQIDEGVARLAALIARMM